MADIEDVSEGMSRKHGVEGIYYSVYDGRVFWYVHIKANGLVVYDENQSVNHEQEVLDYVNKALQGVINGN